MTSPSGDFAFGFRSLEFNSSLFLLAIWFNNTSSRQPIIWFAKNLSHTGAPILAPTRSKLSLTQTGELILAGPTSETIWSPGPGNAAHLALLDQGNLILFDDTESAMWQSFDSPTDTLVPGQILAKNSAIQSKLTDSEFSPGRFKLEAHKDGYLAFFLVVQPPDPTARPYWKSNNNNLGTYLVFDLSGLLYYGLPNKSSSLTISEYPTKRYYQHATIDPDSVFRVYVYDKNLSGKGDWSVVNELPENACSMLVDVGGGMCGFNSYCIPSSNSNLPRLNCLCPANYSFFDANRPYLGCRPDFALQNCSADETADFKFAEMKDTDWKCGGDYMHFVTGDEGECRTSCLIDCFCTVAIYRDTDCWKKKLPLSNGQQGSYVGGKALIKVRVSGASVTPSSVPVGSFSKKDRVDFIVAGAAMLGTSLILIAATIIVSLYFLRSKRGHETNHVDLSLMGMSMKTFSYKDLHDATKGFTKELGRGVLLGLFTKEC
jgi:D-mannose binding lectin